MTSRPSRVLIAGATGSIGRHAVTEALRHGYAVRAKQSRAGGQHHPPASFLLTLDRDSPALGRPRGPQLRQREINHDLGPVPWLLALPGLPNGNSRSRPGNEAG